MTQNISEVTDQSFQQEVLDADTPVLVDFWATWCGPCKALAPTLEALAGDYAATVKFCKVDIDKNQAQAARFGIRSVPTIILFKEGKPAGQLVGNVPRMAIETLISKNLS